MIIPNLLAAGINPEILFAAFAILVLFIQMIGRLFNAATKPAQPPIRRPVPPARLPGQPEGNKDGDPLRSEIEEFLKRVSNRRDAQQPGQANPAASGQQRPGQQGTGQQRTVVPPRPVQQRPEQQRTDQQRGDQQRQGQSRPGQGKRYVPPQQGGQRKRQPPVIVATAGSAAAEPVEKAHDSIEDHVKKFLSNQQFQNTEQISSIDRQEKQFDKQVEQVFAHEVGHLRPSNLGNATQATDVTRTNWLEQKTVPVLTAANLRTAIILNEILQRPEHRW